MLKLYKCILLVARTIEMTTLMWTASLVLTCLSCMHMVLFVKEYTSREMIWPHFFLKNILLEYSSGSSRYYPHIIVLWNVHVSIVPKLLLDPLLVLDKAYVQIYLNFSCMNVLFIIKVPTKRWQWPMCEQTLHSCCFPKKSTYMSIYLDQSVY